MSVSTASNFVTAVNAISSSALKNTYLVTQQTPPFPNGGAVQITITKNGAAFLTVVYEAAMGQFEPSNDNVITGMTVRWVGLDGVQNVVDAQRFINWLTAN